MRRTYGLAIALAFLGLSAPPAARRAGAQTTPVYHAGLAHLALGAAGVSVDASRRLPVNNLGSSGQDGVEVEWPKGGRGLAFSLPNAESDFSTAGCSYKVVVGGTVSGAPAVLGTLQVTRAADGSETLIPSFPTLSADNIWLDLLDASGSVVYTSCCKASYDLKAGKKVADIPSRDGILSSGGRWIEVDMRSPAGSGNFSVTIEYPVAMVVQDGSSLIECHGVRFSRISGPAASSVGPVAIKGTWPVGTGPGAFTIDEEPVGPPCAGLNCPNGPGTQLSVGETALYDQGSSSDTEMRAAPKDTSKIHLRESPSKQSLGSTRPPANSLTLEIRESPTLASLGWSAEGTVDGVPDQVLCTMSCDLSNGPVGPQAQYLPDFSAFGLTSYHVMLSNGGSPVADIVDPVGGFTVLTSNPDDGIEVARTTGGPRIIRNCRTPPCPGEPVIVNGAVYVADHIEVEGLDGSGTFSRTISDVSALEVSSYDAITVYGGTADPVTPVAGVETPGATLDFAPPTLSPNPAIGPVRVRFTLPRSGRANVSVTDVAGRRIRGLADASFAAGVHDLSWDGRNESGRRVSAGVYFVRVESGAQSRVSRVTRLW